MSVADEKQYWDTAAKDKDVDIKYICDIDTQLCLDAIVPSLKMGNILEIGCGVGRLLTQLETQDSLYPSKFYGIDISSKMLSIAKKRSKDTNRVFYKKNDGRTIPFESNSFDSVYSMLVFQHIPNDAKESYIKEASRVLVQGGIFRFQFIEDAELGLVSYGISRDEILTMCEYAGFAIDQVNTEVIHPQWTFITGIKT